MIKLLAKLIARPTIANWLIERAMRVPDEHLPGYMMRYGCSIRTTGRRAKAGTRGCRSQYGCIISCAPIPGATITTIPGVPGMVILRGGYVERRLVWAGQSATRRQIEVEYGRLPGGTATLQFGEYHTVTHTMPGGAWTLFIMGRYRGTWGFLVNGEKINHDEYDHA